MRTQTGICVRYRVYARSNQDMRQIPDLCALKQGDAYYIYPAIARATFFITRI